MMSSISILSLFGSLYVYESTWAGVKTTMGERSRDRIVAVTICKDKVDLCVPLPFYCHVEGYKPILHRDNADIGRVRYINERHNRAVTIALDMFPNTEHIMIIDSYYVGFKDAIERLIEDYQNLTKTLLGGAVLCWDRARLRPRIIYYDRFSIPEMKGKNWASVEKLPTGLIETSGIGASWIFPRSVWERSGGFQVDIPLANTSCLDTAGYRILLDWNARFWRTHENNPWILDQNYSFPFRFYRSVAMAVRLRTRLGLRKQDAR